MVFLQMIDGSDPSKRRYTSKSTWRGGGDNFSQLLEQGDRAVVIPLLVTACRGVKQSRSTRSDFAPLIEEEFHHLPRPAGGGLQQR